MAEIDPTKYKEIADYYADAMKQLATVKDYFYDAAYVVLLLDEFEPEIPLLLPFYNAYTASDDMYLNAPSSAVNAVAGLQRHVLDKARGTDGERYLDINRWIEDPTGTAASGAGADAFTVQQEFADISQDAGFPIEEGNIA